MNWLAAIGAFLNREACRWSGHRWKMIPVESRDTYRCERCGKVADAFWVESGNR